MDHFSICLLREGAACNGSFADHYFTLADAKIHSQCQANTLLVRSRIGVTEKLPDRPPSPLVGCTPSPSLQNGQDNFH